MLNDLKLYKESYDFLLWLYPEIIKFPKSDKYTLGKKLKQLTEELLVNIILANKDVNKKEYLKIADFKLELLRIFIRLSKDLKIIGFKKYETSSKKLDNIGKLLGGLINRFK